MSEPFLGEIRTFAGNFAPNGWALCDGRVLPIAQYTALFSLLGTTYGGDGKVTFGVTGDYDTTADLDVLCHGIETGMQQLLDQT